MTTFGSCGETSEAKAARAHVIVSVISLLAVIFLGASVIGEAVLGVWHVKSVKVHRERGRLKGEFP